MEQALDDRLLDEMEKEMAKGYDVQIVLTFDPLLKCNYCRSRDLILVREDPSSNGTIVEDYRCNECGHMVTTLRQKDIFDKFIEEGD